MVPGMHRALVVMAVISTIIIINLYLYIILQSLSHLIFIVTCEGSKTSHVLKTTFADETSQYTKSEIQIFSFLL